MNQPWTRYLPPFLRTKLEGRVYLQNVICNTGWQFADNTVRMVVGLFVGIWVARYLGPEQFGAFSYALAFVALVTPLANLGLEDIVARDIVRDPTCKDETLGSSFAMKLVGGIVSVILAVVLVLALRPGDITSHWLVGIVAAGTIFQAFGVIEIWFNSQVQAKYLVLARSLAFLLCSAIKVLLIVSSASLLAFAWIYVVELALGSIGLVIAYRSNGYRIRDWCYRWSRVRSLLRDSWPLLFSSIVITIYLRIDQVMLGQIMGSEEVGIYSVAVRFVEIWNFIPMAIFWSVFPAIVEARVSSEELLFGRLQQLYNLMAMAAYAIAIPVAFFAQWLVDNLYGEAYQRAGMMLALLIWANVFLNLEIARSAFLSSMNWTRLHFVTVLLGAVMNIGLNLALIPHYGGIGAVVASLVSYWFAAHGSCFLFRPLFKTGNMLTKAMFFPKVW
jgi:O-antigen/teichoic acid export membrane protein